jgi:hypothetical protein
MRQFQWLRLFVVSIPLVFSSFDVLASVDMGRHRLIVLTDIKADPDDEQSLVRLVLYANEIDIEGIIATTSTHKRSNPAPEAVRDIISAYGQVQSRLVLHDPAFPPEEALLGLVKTGSPVYGMTGVGKGKNSAGSNWIIRALEKDDDRPLWISVWGGVNTLAQALYNIRDRYSGAIAARMISQLRVYTISDQDDSGA